MSADCVIRAFNACDCKPGECRSTTVPLDTTDSALLVVRAKQNAERAVLTIAAVTAIIGLVSATGYALSKITFQAQLEARL